MASWDLFAGTLMQQHITCLMLLSETMEPNSVTTSFFYFPCLQNQVSFVVSLRYSPSCVDYRCSTFWCWPGRNTFPLKSNRLLKFRLFTASEWEYSQMEPQMHEVCPRDTFPVVLLKYRKFSSVVLISLIKPFLSICLRGPMLKFILQIDDR